MVESRLQPGVCARLADGRWVTLLLAQPEGSWQVQPDAGDNTVAFDVAQSDIAELLPPFPKHGISHECLVDFRAAHSEFIEAGATTTEVCTQVVKPMTQSASTSVAACLQHLGATVATGRPHVGLATVFISHAWHYRFRDLLDAIDAFVTSQPEPESVYVWLDLFTNDQHNAPALPQMWWRTTFKRAIELIGHTCLVLLPWASPIPLKRAWCLWEVLCTVESAKVRFTAQLPSKEVSALENAIENDGDAVSRAFATVDVRTAEAFLDADKKMILGAVESTVGFGTLNSQVGVALRAWVANVALRRMTVTRSSSPASGNQQRAHLFVRLLRLAVNEIGHLIDYQEWAKISKELTDDLFASNGPKHPLTLDARHYSMILGYIAEMRSSGKNPIERWYPIQKQLVDDRLEVMPFHPMTGNEVMGLGFSEQLDSRNVEAVGWFEKACEIFDAWQQSPQGSKAPGDSEENSDAANAVGNLIDSLRSTGQLQEARVAHQRFGHMVSRFINAVGTRNRLALLLRAKLAQLTFAEGERDEGLAELESVVTQLKEVAGATHPQTLRYEKVVREMRAGDYKHVAELHLVSDVKNSILLRARWHELLRPFAFHSTDAWRWRNRRETETDSGQMLEHLLLC